MKKRLLAWTLTVCLGVVSSACAINTEAEAVSEPGILTAQEVRNTPAQSKGSKAVNRLEFVKILAEASGEDVSQYTNQANAFNDVNDPSVGWAYAKWLVNGGDNGSFRPSDIITRQEAAAILGRYLDYKYTQLPPGCGTGSPSLANVANWAQNGVSKCWMYGVIELSDESMIPDSVPDSDGIVSISPDFRPGGTVSAEEARAWAENANKVNISAIPVPSDEDLTFADSLTKAAIVDGNFTLSPYSARMCLAMLANGAKGDTQKELLSALKINDLAAFNQEVKKQLEVYESYERVMSLETANSIWLNQTRFGGNGAFIPQFVNSMRENYRAEAQEVTSYNSVERVNAWVNEKTKSKIPSILNEENRDFAVALVNAVYFKAAWENEFYEGMTDKADFTNTDGTKSKVDMMHRTDNISYYSTPGIEAVKLDYRDYAVGTEDGEGWERFSDADFSMYFIKSDKDLAVQNFLDNAEFSSKDLVRLSIPKFKTEYGNSLDAALKSLGVKSAYDIDKADLSGMADPSSTLGGALFLDAVLQKTYIAIDEKGTEAAAVTAAIAADGAAFIERPPLVREFTADSPFWFAIRDNTNGEILFVGRCENL